MYLLPESFDEKYGDGEPKIIFIITTKHRQVATQQDDGCPGEGQRAEGVAQPFNQRHATNEAIQPPFRRGYLALAGATISGYLVDAVLYAAAQRHDLD
jgi:hypothetical protein